MEPNEQSCGIEPNDLGTRDAPPSDVHSLYYLVARAHLGLGRGDARGGGLVADAFELRRRLGEQRATGIREW